VQWRVYNQLLQSRSWTTTWTEDPDHEVTGWGTVADHVVNTGASQTPFTLDPVSTSQLAVLDVNLLINNSPGKQNNVQVTDAIAGRNTLQTFPTSICGDSSSPPPAP